MDNAKITKAAVQLLKLSEDLKVLADSVKDLCNDDTDETFEVKAEKPKTVKKTENTVTLEKVRGVLAEKSRDGFTAEIRAIIQKHGADRLSDVKPSEYEAILKEAEVLGNA